MVLYVCGGQYEREKEGEGEGEGGKEREREREKVYRSIESRREDHHRRPRCALKLLFFQSFLSSFSIFFVIMDGMIYGTNDRQT